MNSMNGDIINIFGITLSQLIGKPEVACKGLIRFAISDYFKQKQMNEIPIGYEQFLTILEQFISNRLSYVQIKDVEKIIEKMHESVIENQALFTVHQ